MTEDKQSSGGGLDEEHWRERECRVIAGEKERKL